MRPISAKFVLGSGVIGKSARRAAWIAGGAVAVAAAVWLSGQIATLTGRSNREPEDLRALVAAVGVNRTIEARLSGGFAYGPLHGSPRAANASDTASPDVRIALARIEKDVLVHRTPQALRSLGVAYLVVGDFDRAVPVLEEAADVPAPEGRTLSDLAAGYLSRGRSPERAQDLARALTMAERAVKADTRLAEARFNRAHALERLSLLDEARQAWNDYLTIDDASAWATEARSRMHELEVPPQPPDFQERGIRDALAAHDEAALHAWIDRSASLVRQFVQDELLSTWPTAILERRPAEARAALARARSGAEALAESTGDRFLVDAATAALAASRSTSTATALAHAHDEFRQGLTDYGDDRVREAAQRFESVRGALERAGSSFSVWTGLFLAIGRYSAGDFAGAVRLLEPTIESARARSYKRLGGLAHRVRGLVHGVQGDFAAALDEYREAVAALHGAGEAQDEASMHALLGEVLGFLGESDAAWTEFAAALGPLAHASAGRERQMTVQLTSLAALRDGLPETASYFQHAALINAQRWGRTRAILDARLYQGEIYRQNGNVDMALAELSSARQALASIDDAATVARNDAQILLAQGEAQSRTKPTEAVAALSRALAFFQQSHRDWPVARVLLARSRAYRAQNRDDLAEADLAAGIEIFERRRAGIADEALRSASFEQPWDLYTEMIRLTLTRGQSDRALSVAERGRARTLVEALAGDADAIPVDPATVYTRLPASTVVVYYATLDDRLLIWTLTRAGRTFVDTPVRQSTLAHLVRQYSSEMDAGFVSGRDMESLSRLYDLLLRPVERAIDSQADLVIVPDGPLHAVPFAALVRREQRRFVVERQSVQVAPSLTVFLSASASAAGGVRTADAGVFGNPVVSEANVPDLPEAESEARDVAALYERADLFTGSRATKTAFLDQIERRAVIHFAGHALANETRPDLSRLLLSGADEDSRSLFARDVARRRLSSVALVVLSACRTNTGRIRRGEGVFTLARPFLAAGVPAVVASLWDVNDRATHRLLVSFHRALTHAGSVAAAMRLAQLELMADDDPFLRRPASWAGFTTIGGRVAFAHRSVPVVH